MRWKERLHIASPEIFRLDGRVLLGSIALGAAIQAGVQPSHEFLPYFLIGVPASKLIFWTADFLNSKRLTEMEVQRGLKSFRQGLIRIKKLRREFCPQGILRRYRTFHNEEDRRIFQRIEEIVEEIERQFAVADLYLQRNMLHILPQIIRQAVSAMENGQKLGLLLEFVAKEDLGRLESEELQLREQARQTPSGPLESLRSQASRFKSQQIANVRNAEKDIAIYRAQLCALEAGLGNVRGRIASMVSIERSDVGMELEALDSEISTMDEGMRMANRATTGEYLHAGSRFEASAAPPSPNYAPQSVEP